MNSTGNRFISDELTFHTAFQFLGTVSSKQPDIQLYGSFIKTYVGGLFSSSLLLFSESASLRAPSFLLSCTLRKSWDRDGGFGTGQECRHSQ